ncbi:MAG: uracil phosphoribosyltransferase [Oscillospiraceae bacterium]|nr:uracil phosphoribosyltransferase [Oscillospiraceae bacterium]
MNNIKIFDHPLIQHKTTILRQKSTTNKDFRELVEEITMLMCYEALRDLPLEDVEIETPITKTTQKMLKGKDIAVVPILRAGLGMVNGLLNLVPNAKVGHIGMYRDEETMQPCEYYCKLPADIDKRLIVVVDPMLATGGSAIDAINQIKSYGGSNIKFLCLIAAPEGIEALSKAHPDIEIYCANVDECLNERCYIVPGLGDAGDRIFGTK